MRDNKEKLFITTAVVIIWSLGFWYDRIDLQIASILLLALAIFVELPLRE